MEAKLISWLKNKILGDNSSKDTAKSRLHFVLVQDRTGMSPEEMTQFKKEMISVIEKFFMIDDKSVDISYKRQGDSTVLLINSPVLVRRISSKNGSKVDAIESEDTKESNKEEKSKKNKDKVAANA